MRFFDDGDLIDGLKIATTPIPADQLIGEYHVVWTFCNGKKKTLDWSSDLALDDWHLSITPLPSSSSSPSKAEQPPLHFTADLRFGTLDLTYTLDYTPSKVNHLQLASNNAPGSGVVEEELVLTSSDVRDEQGFPYLHCNFATNEHDPNDDMTNITFVAKRTDKEGILQLGLTKNEKLRLGYAVWDDGTFEPEDTEQEINNQNPEILQKQLQRHMDESVKIHARLVTIQNNINKQVLNATNGMQQAINRAWRSASVVHPNPNPNPNNPNNLPITSTTTTLPLPPNDPQDSSPARKRKPQNQTTVAGSLDPELSPPSQRRKKDGMENPPLPMEIENHHPDPSSGQKRKRGSGSMRGGTGRARKSERRST